ncbi:hypothetical protein ACHAXA_008200 [Cyclostephanos tholiformis]|uniref:Phosphoglucomutase n=1 Tax=Cyclostephanos tholiformis TaxID=382380 RepID=A0ABD3SCD3_9STRA
MSPRASAIKILFVLSSIGRDGGGTSISSAFVLLPPLLSPPLVPIRTGASSSRLSSSSWSSSSSSGDVETTTKTTTTNGSGRNVDFEMTRSSSSSSRHSTSTASEIDSSNTPPNLRLLLDSLSSLKSGSDLRGTYAPSGGTLANVCHLLGGRGGKAGGMVGSSGSTGPATMLTPFAAHCFGAAFARWLSLSASSSSSFSSTIKRDDGIEGGRGMEPIRICVGRDPRIHGERLVDSLARGAEGVGGIVVSYTGLATTPSMYEFVREGKCDAAVMVTASHLPEEKNGMKFFVRNGGLSKDDIDELVKLAQDEARGWYDLGILPPSSGNEGVLCNERVDFMPSYEDTLRRAIVREVGTPTISSTPMSSERPLSGLKVVVNPGNGAGCFFAGLLNDLGADVSGSIHLMPDGTFPITFGVPNPEKKEMVDETVRACARCDADLGIMFDTDADRAGFVLPRVINEDGTKSMYEPLNRNRLIALLGVIFGTSSPGCTIVTDSTTSEGLNKFLEGKLGLHHFRYLRGYANVIGKARELTESGLANAEVAIETSGHCAMRENGFVDDGTYTAVKIIGLLARTVSSGDGSLLGLISDLEELPFDEEFRIMVTDGSLATTTSIFERVTRSLMEKCDCVDEWSLDEENLEGVRVRLSTGGFFMIRQSLHDPVMSMQVESISKEEAEEKVLMPMLELLSQHESLDYGALDK